MVGDVARIDAVDNRLQGLNRKKRKAEEQLRELIIGRVILSNCIFTDNIILDCILVLYAPG